MNYTGTDGNDILQARQDLLENQALYGYGGDDWLYGGTGNDTLSGGAGNDSLKGGTGNDTFFIDKGDGHDVITDATSGDTLQLNGISKGDLARRIDGNNLVIIIGDPVANEQSVTLQGWKNTEEDQRLEVLTLDNNDTVNLSALPTAIVGTSGKDSLDGSSDSDKIYGLAGNDYLFGGGDSDTLYGGAGNDKLYGEDGADELSGGEGNDTLDGGVGNDTFIINKGDGHDLITDARKEDTLQLGEGITKEDLAKRIAGNDLVIIIGDPVANEQSVTLSKWKNTDENQRLKVLTLDNTDTVNLSDLPIVGTSGND
ncbi:MAG: hypothetical protein IK129_03140, partial [Deltaproteobacteria bacterium]|nr:hypothetical protein [Deltaproteobacteria bacterium]